MGRLSRDQSTSLQSTFQASPSRDTANMSSKTLREAGSILGSVHRVVMGSRESIPSREIKAYSRLIFKDTQIRGHSSVT